MTPQYEKLQKVLHEIFELDKADLDFGIYRIMNQKRKQVDEFLSKSLPKQIREILSETQTNDKAQLETELAQAIKSAEALGANPNDIPKITELRSRLSAATNVDALEQEVYSHLASFFKRYYKEGDFISMRRYKKDVYAIPYEGEEVKLYWANHDQYYIKTSEYLKNYTFKIDGDRLVRFQLQEASTEQNNNRTQGDQERRFAIYEEIPVEVSGEELIINFTYEPYSKSVKQDELSKKAFDAIKTATPNTWSDIFILAPTEKNATRTLIEKHLNDFISRNTFDYFIHKDLGGFLRRELDFYIKNEVLFIDDIDTENPIAFTAQLSKIKALKAVAGKIITFLAQIEDFQKKLWLKKKFVIRTEYCITLDRIPEKYYPEILANQEQLVEWKFLFDVTIATIDDLKGKPFLVLDTKFFSEEFKDKLLTEFTDLDDLCDGLLINSDNFQALNLLLPKFKERIQSTYIDPPYNTVHSKILYKNQFEHSSWLSLINNTLDIVPIFWADDFTFGLAIDDYEQSRLNVLLLNTFPNFELSNIVINHHPQGSGGRLSRTHEHYFLLSSKDSPQYLVNGEDTIFEDRSFMRSGTAENNYRYGRWKSFYALLYDTIKKEVVGVEEPPVLGSKYPTGMNNEGFLRIYPINSNGEERVWRSSYKTGKKRVENKEIFITDRGAVKQKIVHEKKAEVVFSNWVGPDFNAGINGSNVLFNMGIDFDYPKSLKTMERIITVQSYGETNNVFLDYFAGSGTTVHSIINLNRNFEFNRKYIAIDVGAYFSSIILPRTKKAIYTNNWQNGKPQDREGISQMFKYQLLESYEDTLNNLILLPTAEQTSALQFSEQVKEEYLLQYMLDIESRDHLFNIEMFRDPFNYKLKVTENNELVPTQVDLVETFNYLIGLQVRHIQRRHDIKLVEGVTRDGLRTLVIWRNLDTTSEEDLDKVLGKLYDSIRSNEFDQIYINGDHHLDNWKREESTYKVKLIEEAFFNKMFNVSEL